MQLQIICMKKKKILQRIVVYLNDPIHKQTSMSHLRQPFKI